MAPVVVIGAGPGIGGAVALRFARPGLPVALVARSANTVQAIAATLGSPAVPLCLTADAADEAARRGALATVSTALGVPETVVYNAAIIRRDCPGDLPVRDHLQAWAVNVMGALTAAAHILPAMARAGAGSFIVTGGMPEPDPRYTSLSLGQAGARAPVSLLARQYWPDGVHVATVTAAGPVAPARHSTPTTSPGTTGGCTLSRAGTGSSKTSTDERGRTQMRAIQIGRFGGPEVLEVREVAAPVPAAGELVVRTIASSINPVDVKTRSHVYDAGMPPLPMTLGWDLAGVVADPGPAALRPGQRVIAMSPQLAAGAGTWADLVALPAGVVAPRRPRSAWPRRPPCRSPG